MLFYFLKKPILVLLRIRNFFIISFVIFDKVVNIMIKSPEKKVPVMFSSGQGLCLLCICKLPSTMGCPVLNGATGTAIKLNSKQQGQS